MTYLDFPKTFSAWPVIPVIEIEKAFPGFDRNALTRWQEKGYLEKIRRGYYRLTSRPVTGDADLFFIANRIYSPSYISIQSALRWYDFDALARDVRPFLFHPDDARRVKSFPDYIGSAPL